MVEIIVKIWLSVVIWIFANGMLTEGLTLDGSKIADTIFAVLAYCFTTFLIIGFWIVS